MAISAELLNFPTLADWHGCQAWLSIRRIMGPAIQISGAGGNFPRIRLVP